MKWNNENIINKKFNRLLILREVYSVKKIYNGIKSIQRFVECKCECGNTIITRLLMVVNNKAKSCGCLIRENDKLNLNTSTHNLSSHRLYKIYHGMIRRCHDKNNPAYKNYGGRGINVCKQWRGSFISFYNWATKNGYKADLQIDRIRNNAGYSPSNCRFITKRQQARNRRSNKVFYINGVRYLQIDLAKLAKVCPNTIEYHVNKGKTAKEILSHFKVKI